ncbi:MAG: hypothetical protein HY721_33410, partial [Planctomycetes bacterium]|nr:hypothetical protein [Planctomycetota bacterium]
MAESRRDAAAVLVLLAIPAAIWVRGVESPERRLEAEPAREAQLAQELEDLFSR